MRRTQRTHHSLKHFQIEMENEYINEQIYYK